MREKPKIIVFDRDGVIVRRPNTKSYSDNHPRLIQKPTDQVISCHVAELIGRFGGVIASNQKGVSLGYKTQEQVVAEMQYLIQEIPGLVGATFCPDEGRSCTLVTEAESRDISALGQRWRKPDPGMLRYWSGIFEVVAYVGDLSGFPEYADGRDSDKAAAIAAGIPYVDVGEAISSPEKIESLFNIQ
jgi:histidinol phosphatase-like enzyme